MKGIPIFVTVLSLFAAGNTLEAKSEVTDTLGGSKSVAQSPAELLKGKVSGVRVSLMDGAPNGALNTNIRGFNSLRGDSQPLWVVNGVILTNGLSQNLNAFWQKGGLTTKGDFIPDYSELSYSPVLNSMAFLNPYDIENIEVLKDLSATAKYGTQGANGVIIVNTHRSTDERTNVFWRSNVSVDISGRTGSAFRPGVNHNHTIGVNKTINNTSFDITGFIRNTYGIVRRTGSLYGGINLSLENTVHSIVWFGFNSILSVGKQENAAGAAYLGKPSTMILSRYPNRFTGDSLKGWEEDFDDEVEDYRALNSVWLQLNFLKGFYFKASLGADFESNTRRIWYGNGTSFGASSNGAASIMSSTLFNYNAKGEFNFSRYIASKHHITASAAVEVIGSKNKFGVMNGTSFDLHYLRARGLSTMTSRAIPYKFTRDYIIVGTYGLLSYDYDGIAGVNALYRADFSTKYDGSKPISYPAADAFVDIHKIAFPDNKIVTALKLTGGYGEAGREDYIPYEMLGNYLVSYPSVPSGTEVFYDGLNRIHSAEWNVGAKISFIDKVNLSVKYYDKKATEEFFIYNFGKKIGVYHDWAKKHTLVFSTEGAVRNRGLEFDGDFRILEKGKWTLTAFANFTWNFNNITKVKYEDRAGRNIGKNVYVNLLAENNSVGTLYGYAENADGSIADLNGDGDITDVDRKILGNTLPKYMAALGATLRYDAFTLEFVMDGVFGYNVANLNKMIAESRTKLSSRYVERGDHARLSNVTFSYIIPVKWKPIRSLKVNLSATNLFTITKYKGWNPDVNCYGSSALSYGLDYGSYPTVRSIVLGISANF